MSTNLSAGNYHKRVVFFSRKPLKNGHFSAEMYFKIVRENLKEPFIPVYCEMPFYSKGILPRIGNCIYAAFKQGDINHIAGDIHYVSLLLRKNKTILTVLDCGMLHKFKGLKLSVMKFFWYTVPKKKVMHFTAISTNTKNELIKFAGCSEEKISVVYVCINPAFKYTPKVFNFTNPRILHLGTAENKNLDRTVESLRNVPCTLVIVGEVAASIEQKLKQYNFTYEILSRGLTDDQIRHEYEKCDILSFISTFEGFGMPIVEANAVGRVVITGNISSMPEVANDAACLVDPYSIDDIRSGFSKIINDGEFRDFLIQKGKENVRRFSMTEIGNEYSHLYSTVLERK